MRWVNRARFHATTRMSGESGAAVVFVAVVLLGLLAFTALAIDFGRIWQERRELQLGATAGVLAVAEDCARSLCDGAYNEILTADNYADANASDGAASVFSVDLDLAGQSVYVATATETSAGGNTLNMLFAGIVGFQRLAVSADAEAAWGTPLEAATLPLIISDCEWAKTEPGWPAGSPATLPDANANLSSYPVATITFLDPLGVDDVCTVHPGLDLPGGFGWVDTSGGCVAQVLQGGTISADPGASPSSGCSPADFENLLGKAVLVPYFSEVEGMGANAEYTVAGHGAFVVAGYNFGGSYREYLPEYLPGGLPCGPPTTCVAGFFVKQVIHGGGPGGFGGENRGAVEIRLIG